MIRSTLLALLTGASLFAGCAKKDMPSLVTPPGENVIDRICKPWKLTTYSISTNVKEYDYGDTYLAHHSLRTMNIKRDGSYIAADTTWSGSYQFLHDSTQILFTPYDTTFVAFTLQLYNLTDKEFFFYTPVVAVNPEQPGESLYESFVAYEALSWLEQHGVDDTGVRAVRIIFSYYEDDQGQ